MNYILKITISLFYLSAAFCIKAQAGLYATDPEGGYEITVLLKPFKNCKVVLAHYYGTNLQTDATATLDENSKTIFKGTSKLHEGIYVVYDESSRGGVDFLVDTNQHFSIMAEIGDHDQTIDFHNSTENELLKAYKRFMAFKEVDIVSYRTQLAATTNDSDSAFYIHQLKLINDSIQLFRESIRVKYPATLLTALLSALKEPDPPAHLQNPKDSTDSAAVRYYTKVHYWDGVDFWDGRLLYTPFLNGKIDKYFTEIVERKTDSAVKQIDWMMGTAVASEEMSHFILEKLFFGAMYHQFKWDDPVFIHLYEKYIADKTYPWLHPEDRKRLVEYAQTLMANSKGTKAYEISLPGLNGQKESLLGSSNAKYTLLVFWDVTCSHCQETLPVLDSLYQAKWEKAGFKIFAVSVESDGNRPMWKEYIKAHHLEEWTHVYYSMADEREQAEKTGQRMLQPYNVWYYPSFYLLDQDKRFMAKKLSYQPMADLINSIINKKQNQ
ncbi:MAG: DUF5106 domain-containing protein [Williamsia sp.]|nr:DUF5106 domain-containing protein [Williamsia sp.]